MPREAGEGSARGGGHRTRILRAQPVRLGVVALVLGLVGRPGSAWADKQQQQCLAASERAQVLRNAGRLNEAREQLVTCGRTECPKVVQQDCSEWMKELLAILPSVVPSARDAKGRDVDDVRFSIDGKVVAEALDGKAIPIDPGVHTFKFESPRSRVVEEKIVVRQGEKNRIVAVVLEGIAEASTTAPSSKAAAEEQGSSPIAAYVTGGIGLVALGTALVIDLDAVADARDLRETCAPHCEQGKVDDVEERYLIAGVTAALGGAALVAGIVLYFTHDRGTKASGSRFVPSTSLWRGATAEFRF